MKRQPPDWEDLNAYVDGELATPAAAGVAGAVAGSPDLARKVSELTRLKAAVQEYAEEAVPPDLARVLARAGGQETRPVRQKAGPRRAWGVLGGLAAALALLVLGASLLLPSFEPSSTSAWRETALRLHDDWARRGASAEAAPTAGALLAGLSSLEHEARVPDLSSARLSLGHLRRVTADGGPGLHVGYNGTRGCRVSLVVLEASTGLPEEPQPVDGSDLRAHAWRSGPLAYVLLASGMDPDHYQVILRTVHEATRRQSPLDEEMRTALSESRARSRPCMS